MRYIKGQDRKQQEMLPPSLDERIAPDHMVRVIDAFVEGIDIDRMGFTHAEPADTGRNPYDPRDLLKLYLYGYPNRVRSSRRLERECERNIEVMWLMNSLTPDFRTIADFRKENKKGIVEVFRSFVKILKEMNLLGTEGSAVDGTKMRAWNSMKRSYKPEIVEKKLAYIEEQIQKLEAYLTDMDGYDEREESKRQTAPYRKGHEGEENKRESRRGATRKGGIPWQKPVYRLRVTEINVGCGLEDKPQILIWFQPIFPGGFNDTVKHGAGGCAIISVREQPVFPTDHKWLDTAFGTVVGNLQAAVKEHILQMFVSGK